jgi:hypothetical protein
MVIIFSNHFLQSSYLGVTSQVFQIQTQHAFILILAFEIKFESNFKTRRLHFKEISFKAYVSQFEFLKIIS